MADQFDDALFKQFLAGQTAQADALNAIASRPQKASQTTTTAPVTYADMLARRNQIGAERAMLNEALKQRETFGYGLANALASMPAQQGAGSWLGDFARGFGSAFNARANAAIDRAKQDYEAAQADLATALAFDKAMGDVQQQIIDYKPVPYVPGKTTTTTGDSDRSDKSQQMARQEVAGKSLADVHKTIGENELLFSELAPVYQDADSRALKSGVKQMGIQGLGRAELQYLQSIMPKGFAGAINQAREQELMRPLTTAFESGPGTEKQAAIVNYYGSIYDEYEALAKTEGYSMPMTRQEYISSRLATGRELNPAYFTGKSTQMYKEGRGIAERPNIKEGGFVVNGFRFKGGDVHDKNNWEKVQ